VPRNATLALLDHVARAAAAACRPGSVRADPTRESFVKNPFPRAARKAAVVCLAFAAVLGALLALASRAAARDERRPRVVDTHLHAVSDARARSKVASRPLELHDAEGAILAFPPRASSTAAGAARPLTVVYLHGVHGLPENGCPWLRDGATELGWLVCPHANARLANGTFSWGGSVAEQRAVVARAERAAAAEGADDARANVLVGFSQGAFVALDLVQARLGRYRGLVLIGADVAPSRATLEAGGVGRVVLAAGELDASFRPLTRAAAALARSGMEVRFVGLGRIGHSYETTEKEALREAIAWAGGA
jgi:predicted esterase